MNWPLMGETITWGDRLAMAKFVMTTNKFTNGPRVKKFEEEWSEWLDCNHSLYVSSGSTANFLLIASIMELYDIKPGDKVLLPACTWMTNVSPCIQLGLTPIFCDINLQNFSFDLEDAKYLARKHPDIKLIFVSHLLGFPGENEKLAEIFPTAKIVDDVCESHGCTSLDGLKVGSKSLGATFSFYFGHHMSTIEGGMVSTFNPDLYDIMKMKRSHGLARESIMFDEYAKWHPKIDKQFLFVTDGYNFRNHEVCAVLGSRQLKRLDRMVEIRRDNYREYWDIMQRFENIFYPHEYEDHNSSFCFPFVCRSAEIMKKLKEVFKSNGIEYRPIVGGNLLGQPFLRAYSLDTPKERPNADIIEKQGVYIGNNHFITQKNMIMLFDVIGELNAKCS